MTVENLIGMKDYQELDYGSIWSEAKLVEVFDIKLPDLSGNAQSIIKNAKEYELKKVQAYCMINEQILNNGMCFIQDRDSYRVPAISEVNAHITKYYNSSNRKFKRAEKLRKSFSSKYPVEAKEVNDKANRTSSLRDSQSKAYQPMNG